MFFALGSLAGSGAWPAALQLIRASMAQQLQQNVVIYGSWVEIYGMKSTGHGGIITLW
jgi:hypothetical protein